MRVAWISAGVSSFIAAYLGKPDKCIYIDIADQHPDSIRFIKDCEKALGMKIEILSSEYKNVENVCRTFNFVNGIWGAKCTEVLKKRVRKLWESKQTEPITYIWGMDCTEKARANKLCESMPKYEHVFPLIDNNLTKEEAHGILERLGIRRPVMYDMGYRNNNCVGCVKGGMGYWNKIRRDFPDVFESRAKMERDLGHSCIKGVFLDELDPNRGRNNEVLPECGIACELAI